MADMNSADILGVDWARRARELLAGARPSVPKEKTPPEMWRGGTFRTEPVEIRQKNVLTDPDSWLNRGLEQLGRNAVDAMFGEGTGSTAGDILLGLTGPGAAIGTAASGNRPGVLDMMPGGGALKAGLIAVLTKNRKFHDAMGKVAPSIYAMHARTGLPISNTTRAILQELEYPEAQKITGITKEELNILKQNANYISELDEFFPEREPWNIENNISEEAAKNINEALHIIADREYQKSMQDLRSSNPKRYIEEIRRTKGEEGIMALRDELASDPETARKWLSSLPKSYIDELGLKAPEKVQAPVVQPIKKVEPKGPSRAEIKAQQQAEYNQKKFDERAKMFRREPEKLYREFEKTLKGKPVDESKLSEFWRGFDAPEGFTEGFARYKTDKAASKAIAAEQAVQAEREAELFRQSAAPTEKQASRSEAEQVSREQRRLEAERLEREREARHAADEAVKAERMARSPESVVAAGWNSANNPLISGDVYPAFIKDEPGRRSYFIGDSLATTVLKGLEPFNQETGETVQQAYSRTRDLNTARHEGTTYDDLWPLFRRKLDETYEEGLHTMMPNEHGSRAVLEGIDYYDRMFRNPVRRKVVDWTR